MAPQSNTPGLQLRILSLEVWSRTEADVFLLSSSNFMHKSTSFLDCVIEGNGRNEGPVPFISSEGYRACAFWRKALIGPISSSFALIGQHIPSSDWSNLEPLALDDPTRPLLSSDWSESDSSIQPLLSLYGKFHALSRVSAGRWGVTRER